MGRLWKAVLLVALIGVVGALLYALVADLPAPVREIRMPVEAR